MKDRQKRHRNEAGAALLELSFAVSFLMITIFGVIDLGRWLNTYLTASRLAYETARFTASEIGLPVTGTSWADDVPLLLSIKTDGSVDGVPTMPPLVHTRIQRLLARHAFTSIDVNGSVDFQYSQIHDATIAATAEASSKVTRVVQISVSIPFQSWSARIFGSNSVRSTARIPSLF